MLRKTLCMVLLFCSTISHSESIRLATSEWPPYVSTHLKGMGYVYMLVTTAFQESGYDPIVEFLPWTETIQLKKYKNEAYFPEYNGVETDKMICSTAIDGGPIGLFKRKDDQIQYTVQNPRRNQKKTLYALRKYRFGTVEGYTNTAIFDQADFLIKKPVISDLANLRQLNTEQVDLIISDVFVTEYYLDKFKPEFDNLEFMGPALETKRFYVCFSKANPDYEKKLTAFNQKLNAMQKSG